MSKDTHSYDEPLNEGLFKPPTPFYGEAFPTFFGPSDRVAIESSVQRIGRILLSAARQAEPTPMSSDWWSQQAGEWATLDDALKVRLFRLVDVMPMLDDAASLERHMREYLDEELLRHLPFLVRLGIQIARSRPLGRFVAKVARAGTLAQAHRFIAGSTPREAALCALGQRRLRRAFTLDSLGEAVTSESEADAYAASYHRLLKDLPPLATVWPSDPLIDEGSLGPLPRVNISIKLSALDSQFDAIDPHGSSHRVLQRLRPLCRLARMQHAHIHIDMESYATKDLTLAIFRAIALEDEFRDWTDIGVVVQCYLHDACADLLSLLDFSRFRGTPFWVRLVKGAYWDYETIHAQAAGWNIPVFNEKWMTDACFEAATMFLIEHSAFLRPAIGSHNLRSIAHAMACAEHLRIDRRTLELQMLYGMGDPEKKAVTDAGWRLRVYMPYGLLVPGMAYLVRRLLENTSNDSFLRAGFVKHLGPEKLFASPVPLPAPCITIPLDHPPTGSLTMPLPSSYEPPPFANEPHTDFTRQAARESMTNALSRVRATLGGDCRVVIDGRPDAVDDFFVRQNPSDHSHVIGRVAAANRDTANRSIDVAASAFFQWSSMKTSARSAIIVRAAEIMRTRRYDLAALEVLEVGKPWRDADADVAEAIDFCNYYARSAIALDAPRNVDVPGEENHCVHLPRGVVVVIAPWNFPLAILAGMTTAALVTGNTVVMKPAEQASFVGQSLYTILIEAGVPPSALGFLPGRGEEIGPVLVSHSQTALVAFTGSRAVGLEINRLAAESSVSGSHSIKKVIAEMGGKNAILIDDDADLDEAVLGVIGSAFHFCGQKCSACSRVIVLEKVYDTFLERLRNAAQSISIGPAWEPGVRMGPLVDELAASRVREYIEIGRKESRQVVSVEVGELARRGSFVGPHIFAEVDPESRLGQEEIFGPVLAVMKATNFDHALLIANSTPFALTAGVWSRSPAHLLLASKVLAAGNIYLNRGITGAMVNRQPFGGYRMSGTGRKAGGPEYLQQFVVSKTITENTMRRGFAPQSTSAEDSPQKLFSTDIEKTSRKSQK